MDDLAQQAVSQALSGRWEDAQKTNLEIIKHNPQDTEALNRLATAYFKLGKITQAQKISEKVLKIDPYNTIAEKALKKWKGLTSREPIEKCSLCSPQTFLEQPGKTTIVNLINLGDKKTIARVSPGEKVKLACHTHRVSINTLSGKYLGRLSDDLAAKIRKEQKSGKRFQASVKSATKDGVKVFIQEIKNH